jgi:nicotinate-nucleotide pyrophosphorylase (carboxylating)
MGGGQNHRFNLGDAFLIKDNHLASLSSKGMNIKKIVTKARKSSSLKIEVEVKSVDEAIKASKAGVDVIMLDNMNIDDMRRAVELVGGKAQIEASGGITIENVCSVAETGVNLISVGALTHSAKTLDICLDLEV